MSEHFSAKVSLPASLAALVRDRDQLSAAVTSLAERVRIAGQALHDIRLCPGCRQVAEQALRDMAANGSPEQALPWGAPARQRSPWRPWERLWRS